MSNAPTPDLDAKPSVKNGGAKDADMKITDKSLALCHAIEAAGASEALTKCSVLASELHAEMQRLTKLSDTMKRFVAENYPEDEKGQVDFVRVLVEGYAEEIIGESEELEAAK